MDKEPESLKVALGEGAEAIRRVYAEGYKQGMKDAVEHMARAASAVAESKVPAILGDATTHQPQAVRMAPPRRGLADAPRSNEYGTVIATLRQALLTNPQVGMTRDDLLQYCRQRGLEITRNQYRDTMKRLLGGEEVERRHDSYFPGKRLKGLAPANGAANGKGNGLFS